ncbi:hypothetical protein NIES2101_36255 [Calothrix sp. HK-06]|nr:hypothetical protein NIES2101_36255 [Calothrix sp. HK-06]
MAQYNSASKRKRGVVLTVAGLKKFQSAILEEERRERGGRRFTQAELSERIGVSTPTISRLWSLNCRVDPRTLRMCFSTFNLRLDKGDYTLFNDGDVNDINYSEEVIDGDFPEDECNADLFSAKVEPQIVSTVVSEDKIFNAIILREKADKVTVTIQKVADELSLNHHSEGKIDNYCRYPCGPLSLDSELYIPRPPMEELAYKEIMQPGCVIRIQGCQEMGKTSLMLRILAYAKMLNYETVKLDINQVDTKVIQKPELFMQWFIASIYYKLGLEYDSEKYWNGEIGNKLSCTLYMKECLLTHLEQPLLLVLDNVHHIFEFSDSAKEFLPLLRSWQEEAQQEEIWHKLRMLIVYSTEVYIPLNINQSPFNIGLPLKLSRFNTEQVIELAKRYGIDWRGNNQAQQLMKLVGGHPALVNLTLYYICCKELTLEEICKTAITPISIYRQHLQSLLSGLKQNSQLLYIFTKILEKDDNIHLDLLTAYKLESIGLIQLQQQKWQISCQLYEDFFGKYLTENIS